MPGVANSGPQAANCVSHVGDGEIAGWPEGLVGRSSASDGMHSRNLIGNRLVSTWKPMVCATAGVVRCFGSVLCCRCPSFHSNPHLPFSTSVRSSDSGPRAETRQLPSASNVTARFKHPINLPHAVRVHGSTVNQACYKPLILVPSGLIQTGSLVLIRHEAQSDARAVDLLEPQATELT